MSREGTCPESEPLLHNVDLVYLAQGDGTEVDYGKW